MSALRQRVIELGVSDAVAWRSLLDVERHVVVGAAVKCGKDGVAVQAERTVAVNAVQSAIRACRLAGVWAVLWGQLYSTWMQSCSVKEGSVQRLFVPYDSMVSHEHFGVLYVCCLGSLGD